MFLSRIRASSDDRSPYGDFWFQPVSMRSSTGSRVSPDGAMQLTAVFSCVRVRAESFSILPLKVYKRDNSTGRRKLVPDHWLYPLFRKPNPYQNGLEWRQMCQAHLDLRGNCFNLMQTDRRGNILSVTPLHPDRVSVVPIDEFDYVYRYIQRDGTQKNYSRADIWHMRTTSLDGYVGLSPISASAPAIALGLAAQEYGARFFQNDTRSGGVITLPGNFKDKAQRETFRESFQAAQTGVNRHKTPILEYGMTYTELGATNKDSQFLEARGYTRSEIAGIYRVPPHMIGDLSRATFTNIEQQSLEFVNNCMSPTAELWEVSARTDLLLEDEADIEVEFDFARLLRGDQTARAAFYISGINAGWMTRNEARQSEGLEPIDGLDEPLRPLNMVEESDVGTAADPSVKPAPVDDDTQGDEGEQANARFDALLAGNARRMARRLAKGDVPTAQILADALAITVDAAAAWSRTGRTEDELTESLLALAKGSP